MKQRLVFQLIPATLIGGCLAGGEVLSSKPVLPIHEPEVVADCKLEMGGRIILSGGHGVPRARVTLEAPAALARGGEAGLHVERITDEDGHFELGFLTECHLLHALTLFVEGEGITPIVVPWVYRPRVPVVIQVEPRRSPKAA